MLSTMAHLKVAQEWVDMAHGVIMAHGMESDNIVVVAQVVRQL
jgi:hypothetical protein